MTYGLLINNIDGYAVISEDNSNFLVTSKYDTSAYEVHLNSSFANQMYFVRPLSMVSSYGARMMLSSDEDWDPYITQIGVLDNWTQSAAGIQVALANLNPPDDNNYGLRVYSETGAIQYSSGFNPVTPVATGFVYGVGSYYEFDLSPASPYKKYYVAANSFYETGDSGANMSISFYAGYLDMWQNETHFAVGCGDYWSTYVDPYANWSAQGANCVAFLIVEI